MSRLNLINPFYWLRAAVGGARNLIVVVLALVVVLTGAWEAFKWSAMRVYVGPDEALVVISKFGEPLPQGMIVVPRGKYEVYKGVQEEVRGPGRYFLNPVEYDWKVIPQVQISAGDPTRWQFNPDGLLQTFDAAPQVGLVSQKQGKIPPPGKAIVDPDEKGLQKIVLTPGTYKINPYLHEVTSVPAEIVPPGSVGVVTRLFGDVGEVTSATLTEIRESTTRAVTRPATEAAEVVATPTRSRLVTGNNQRGILRDVLQPGIYYLNPRLYKVSILPVGYDAITLEHPDSQIRFYSKDGYPVEADFTVVWGRSPADAPNITANIGDITLVRTNVLEPAMKAACQNEGAKYFAKELIQGSTRSAFQDDLSVSLERQVQARNIHVLLALIRNIMIKDNTGDDSKAGLLATIQQANIEIERELTNEQKTKTAETNAQLEQALKLVDVARETVASDTKVKTANILADGQKKAAEIDAQREVDVANIGLKIAQLDAGRTQILGKADADVQRLTKDAEAEGYRLMIDAFGSSRAYNNYIFASNFAPTDLRLIFAGPGTFWTDLKTFQDVGSAMRLQDQTTGNGKSAAPKSRGTEER